MVFLANSGINLVALLVIVKSVLYDGTIALGTGVDFGKVLGRSEP